MKVLIVDDSAIMRKVLVDALLRADIHNIGQAKDGQAAVEAVANGHYELILMDWDMPKMNGIEAVKALRSKGINIPIIMVASEAEKSNVIEALRAGANNYILKPFTPEIIASKIKEVMGQE